ncbi:UDP-4-amino-4,6-dideoxy-N-acetyl-beta-L-altrosamine N-acetyltransferase [Uliginosibacterium aquaticum]|uniref:UDP-4-amino-4, 6-dideoxy-N-acetyl-beta-L-altrosamine N-acetyltransferase n=1 Tax=Uliginosibacterium aquaticum TaxID=2731212 RepID=A0ABX2IEQ9_9RHOO|nr:UDP-4-amino-4,6-dideoxy-N-acetyl-beta-L-altrosamine N-acetyltransferase [Uliginosibacterium aquaticum]NSL55171.1 UDP-4-amino-4,6-dideoxy-N-acetyl-beta-L-altrosamine N-acetyltransferase [Uliginosibacterium aquaticum]
MNSAAPACLLRPLEARDLPLLLAWRNHPSVRSAMFRRREISATEHAAWFAAQHPQAGRHLLIYEENGIPLGHVNFSLQACPQIAEWGFYRAPEAPAGSGQRMGRAAIDWAFDSLGLHKIAAQVIADNPRSLAFHRKLGFQPEGILREHFHDGQSYLDVHCFGLLRPEWQAMKDAHHD